MARRCVYLCKRVDKTNLLGNHHFIVKAHEDPSTGTRHASNTRRLPEAKKKDCAHTCFSVYFVSTFRVFFLRYSGGTSNVENGVRLS